MFWLFDVQTTTLTNNNKNYFNNYNYYHQQKTKDVNDNKDAEFTSHTKMNSIVIIFFVFLQLNFSYVHGEW